MNDLQTALAAERTNGFLIQARSDGLARIARCCTRAGASVVERVQTAGAATLRWLRKGQLGGLPCAECRV
jgi:predicted component of type VI protein secretion system